MDKEKALKVLGVETPYSTARLKSAFRERSFRSHPDMGGSTEAFDELKKAHDALKSGATDVELPETTEDGRRMADLGKGYPLTESAKTCTECEGRGHRRYPREERKTVPVTCPECKGVGLFSYPCKKCGGHGKYIDPSGRERGDCYGCRGTGRFVPMPKSGDWWIGEAPDGRKGYWCKECDGNKTIMAVDENDNSSYLYLVCKACDGVGEQKMWNPVLPRGMFADKTG